METTQEVPTAAVVEAQRVYIYDTVEEAKVGCAFSERARVYKVELMGHIKFVSDINPLTAVGRVAQQLGIVAEPLGGPAKAKDADALLAILATLSPDEQAKFLKMAKKAK